LEYRLEGAFEKPKRRNVIEILETLRETRSVITIAYILNEGDPPCL
jgi:hypothetical protein